MFLVHDESGGYMAKLLRVGFDIDGVLANFVTGFLDLVNRETGSSFVESDWTTYGGATSSGRPEFLTDIQWAAGWAALEKEPCFWAKLDAYPSATEFGKIQNSLESFQFNGYFITRRKNLKTSSISDANALTRIWLEQQGIVDASAIIASSGGNRIQVLKELEIDTYIDDWADQFLLAQEAGIDAYLIDRPYNRHIQTDKRVYSITEYVRRATALKEVAIGA
jgi:uncharacterized HAD superfamily protein